MKRLHTYSQHFLKSPKLVSVLIKKIPEINQDSIVFDLGAGSGIISSELAKVSKSVYAIEKEAKTFEKLSQNLSPNKKVKILNQDILQLNFPTRGDFHIFSNIPFALSSEILTKIINLKNPPKTVTLIVQRQFARKITPSKSHFTSMLGAQASALYEAKIITELSKTDYTPPPAVDTTLISLKLREKSLTKQKDLADFYQFIELCFSRQKYFTNLKFEQSKVNPEKKPSELTPEEWVQLFELTRLASTKKPQANNHPKNHQSSTNRSKNRQTKHQNQRHRKRSNYSATHKRFKH